MVKDVVESKDGGDGGKGNKGALCRCLKGIFPIGVNAGVPN